MNSDGNGSSRPPGMRDKRGRFAPGSTGNKNGRPKKRHPPPQSDPRVFRATLVDVIVNGKKTQVTREDALKNKIFETAMKGDVRAQQIIFKWLRENDRQVGEVMSRVQAILLEFRRYEEKLAPVPSDLVAELQMHLAWLEPSYFDVRPKRRKRKQTSDEDEGEE